MRSRSYKTEAIVLKRVNFGEADKLLALFTKDYGKIKAIAKGVRKIKSRRASHLELFNVSTIYFIQGKTFSIITDASSIKTYRSLRKNLSKVAYAYKVAEVAELLNPEGQKDSQLYQFLVEGLTLVDSASSVNLSEITEDIIKGMLVGLGYLSTESKVTGNSQDRFLEQIFERKLKTTNLLTKINGVG